MTPQEYLLVLFCLIDDELQALRLGRLRRRGPAPTLSDSEVITIELAGEALGRDCDRDVFRFFRRYHTAEFPALAWVHRTTFARQAANLFRVKQLIHSRLAERLACGDPVWLADSLPVHACQFARATFCRRFRGQADYGYDHLIKRTFYGFRLHLRTTREGLILAYELAPARAADAALLAELAPPEGSTGIADRGYGGAPLRQQMADAGVRLLAPPRRKKDDKPGDRARAARLASVRYRVETANGQLAGRYNMKRTWARDLWHLCHRVTRKLLSHTALVWLCFHAGLPPLSFDRLIGGN
jgi:Transposase DDE domain